MVSRGRLRGWALAGALALLPGCLGGTEAAQDITASSARLTFSGSSSSGDADVYFEYGTTTGLGSRTPVERFSGLRPNEGYDWHHDLGGLTPNRRYYFRACGKEHADVTFACGSIRSFITTTFSNPVRRRATDAPVLVGDPKLVRDGSTYYLSGSGCQLFRSSDLVRFEQLGDVCGDQAGAHPAAMVINPVSGHPVPFFGTEVAKVGSRWVLVTSGNRHYPERGAGYTRGAIWIGVASAPGGPYTWASDALVKDADATLVDPSIFVDPGTGRTWVLWTQYPDTAPQSRIRVQELDPNDVTRLRASTAPVTVLSTEVDPQPREVATPTRRLIEGPGLLHRDGRYHLYYATGSIEYDYAAAGGAPYTFNIATSTTFPVAVTSAQRFQKPAAPTLGGGDGWRVPGHGAVFQDGDGTYWVTVSPIADGEPVCVSGSVFCPFTRTVFVQRMRYGHRDGRFTVNDGTLDAGPIGVAIP